MIETNQSILRISTRPTGILVLASVIALMYLVVLMSGAHVDLFFYIIFPACSLLLFMFAKRISVSFSKKTNVIEIVSKNILGTTRETIALNDVRMAQVNTGYGGNYARGGTLVLVTKNKHFVISQSDIGFSSAHKNSQLAADINAWLNQQ